MNTYHRLYWLRHRISDYDRQQSRNLTVFLYLVPSKKKKRIWNVANVKWMTQPLNAVLRWNLSDTTVIFMHLLLTCIEMVPIGEKHRGRWRKVKRYRIIKGHVENGLTAALEIISQRFCEQNLWTGGWKKERKKLSAPTTSKCRWTV